MKILFIGCVESSEALLRVLLSRGYDICGVVTRRSSAFNADFRDLTPICKAHDIPLCYYSKEQYALYAEFVRARKPDIIYCFGWSHLLREDVLSVPPLGTVGYHPSALPQNRGRHPVIWAIALGLKQTASTFFMIQPGVDSGDIVSQESVSIDEGETARTLYDKIVEAAKVQILDITERFEQGTVTFVPQDEAKASSWRKRGERDGQIDFRMSAKTIANLVRALTRPYIGAHFIYGDSAYKVWRAGVVPDIDGSYQNAEFGKVLEVCADGAFLVKTGEDLVRIEECDAIKLQKGDYL